MKIRADLSLVLSALALTCAAQQSPGQSAANQPPDAGKADQPAATLHVQAREVILPVTVRDKHGALVSSLNVSDFALTEDGRPQTIKSFSRQTDLPYKLGLLVDTSRSLSGAMEAERKAAGKFVDTMLPEKPNPKPDEMFLIHFDHQVELLEDFTTSRDKLHKELDDMGPSSGSSDSSSGPETSDDQRDRPSGRNGTQLYDAIYLASSEVIKPNDGRNALVIFSDGVDHGSKDTLNDAIDAADKANVVVYTVYFKGEQERSGGFPGGGRRGGGFPGGGGGYPGGGGGYPGGGGGRRGGEEKPSVDGKKIMEQIATRTGGRYFEAKSTAHLDEIYTQIAEELRGQYLLTYTPDKVDTEGGYHKVALQATKGDLTVVTREGYYAPGGDSKSN
ncbi:MAG: VWA domain-containing protein [Terracidiphilus sp.]